MQHFFESIYLLFDGLYSESLRNYLSGYDCASASYTGNLVYFELGWQTALIALVLSLLYYKVMDPTSHKYMKWGISLLVCAVCAFLWAYYLVDSAETKGLIGDCLLHDDQGNSLIGFTDYMALGFSNSIIAIVWYLVVGLGMKFWSINNRYIPF